MGASPRSSLASAHRPAVPARGLAEDAIKSTDWRPTARCAALDDESRLLTVRRNISTFAGLLRSVCYGRAVGLRIVWIATWVVILSLCGPRDAHADDLVELAERTAASVVLLKVIGPNGEALGSGTGFFAGPGRIATNHHVIEPAAEVVARLHDGRELEVLGVLAIDVKHDLAVLAVADGTHPPALPLGKHASVRAGQKVFVIGSPHGLEGTLSTGIVSAVRAEGVTDEKLNQKLEGWGIQITAPIGPGSSGSPVLTHDGNVVAVAVGIVTGGVPLGFGIPIDTLEQLMATIPEGAEPEPFPKAVSVARNLLISAAVFGGLALAFFIPALVRRLRRRRQRRSAG